MAARKKQKEKASHKEKGDAFFVYDEKDNKDLGTPLPNAEDNVQTKNTLYVYKDKTTTRVHYDSTSNEYKTVYINH